MKNKKELRDKILKVLQDFEEGEFDYGVKLKNGELYLFRIDKNGVKEDKVKELYARWGVKYTEEDKRK